MTSGQPATIGADEICEWRLRETAPGGPALFLDRDGVIVEEVNYLHRPEDVVVLGGAPELIARANELGIPVVVISNQAGIGRGYYGWEDFTAVQNTIDIAIAPAAIDAVLACPFHADGKAPYDVADHPDRKPNPGMLLRAERMLGVDLSQSWFVGDTAADVEAAARAGLAGAIHLLTGHGAKEREAVLAAGEREGFELRCVAGLPEIAGLDWLAA
ncbi:MAG: HAD-IIIA family hydrolase [Thermoleophilaceae bacterium]|nr:HAD-IIIA family hydrolase [Thermoleophilaceae bacterium]